MPHRNGYYRELVLILFQEVICLIVLWEAEMKDRWVEAPPKKSLETLVMMVI